MSPRASIVLLVLSSAAACENVNLVANGHGGSAGSSAGFGAEVSDAGGGSQGQAGNSAGTGGGSSSVGGVDGGPAIGGGGRADPSGGRDGTATQGGNFPGGSAGAATNNDGGNDGGTAGAVEDGGTAGESGAPSEGGITGIGGSSGGPAGTGGTAGAESDAPSARITFPPKVSYTDASMLWVRGLAKASDRAVRSVTVNGVAATTTDGFASWSARVPIADGDNGISVSVTDEAGNTNALADTAVVRNKGHLLEGAEPDLEEDPSRGRLFVADDYNGVLTVDSNTRRVERFLDRTRNQSETVSFGGTATDERRDRVLFVAAENELRAMDRATGEISVVSPARAELPLRVGPALAIDPEGNFAYTAWTEVVEIDLETGVRRVVPGGAGLSVSTGESLVYDAVTNPASPRLLAIGTGGISALDLTTGARSRWLDLPSAGNNGIALATNRRQLLVRQGNTVAAYDLDDKTRQSEIDLRGAFSEDPLELGRMFLRADGDSLLFTTPLGEIFELDLDSGRGSRFAGAAVGSGPRIAWSCGLVVVHQTDESPELFHCDKRLETLVHVDLATGLRTELEATGGSLSTGNDLAMTPPGAPPMFYVLDRDGNVFTLDPVTHEIDPFAFAWTDPWEVVETVRMALDPARGRVLMTMFEVWEHVGATPPIEHRGVFAYELATGELVPISTWEHGSAPRWDEPTAIVVDERSSQARAFVLDASAGTVVDLDVDTGRGSVFARFERGEWPQVLAMDAARERLLTVVTDVNNDTTLEAIDLTTGARELLSDLDVLASPSDSGPVFYDVDYLAVDSSDAVAYMTTGIWGRIFAVDLVSGDRVLVAY